MLPNKAERARAGCHRTCVCALALAAVVCFRLSRQSLRDAYLTFALLESSRSSVARGPFTCRVQVPLWRDITGHVVHTKSLCSFGGCVDLFGGKRRVRRSQR